MLDYGFSTTEWSRNRGNTTFCNWEESIKDDTMAESIVEFLKEHKDTKVLHVQGSFHGDEHLGVVEKVNKFQVFWGIGGAADPLSSGDHSG